MIEGLLMRFLEGYIAKYLDDFDKSNISISLLKGKVSLSNLKLNNKILDNIPFPVKMKYGRVGSIKINVPSFLHIQTSLIDVEISDVFICLSMRPVNEWKDETIVKDFQDNKQSTLDTYEEDATFFYNEVKGDEQGFNKILLQIASNIHVKITNVYLRIEDPLFPFALGVLIPQLEVNSADKNWHPIHIVLNPEIMFKSISLKDLTIFLERDKKMSSIDKILDIDYVWLKEEHNDKAFQNELDLKIQAYIEKTFSQDNIISSQILNKFCLDIRFQFVLDAIALKKSDPDRDRTEPDLSIKIIFGGLFADEEQNCHFMDLAMVEQQIVALLQFSSYSTVFNSYQCGVLTKYYEKEVNVSSPEIKEYVRLYESYQCCKILKDEEKMAQIKKDLSKIESKYRTDLLYWMRRVINEKFYGIQKIEQEGKKETEKQQQSGFFGFLKWGKNKETTSPEKNLIEQDPVDNLDSEEKKNIIKKRFTDNMKEIEAYSKNQYNPYQILNQSEEYTIEFIFQIPKMQFKIYSEIINDIKTTNNSNPMLKLAFEGLYISYRQEAKPEYMKVEVSYSNFCLVDYYSPNKNLPYILQTVYLDEEQQQLTQQKDDCKYKALTLLYEKNPKDDKIAHAKLKLHTNAQLYIYINLNFGTNVIAMITRVLIQNNKNYSIFMSTIDKDIKNKIKEGSFYLELVNFMSQTYDALQTNLIQIGQGQKEKPKLNIDIKFYSPKIILFEELLGEKIIYPEQKSMMVIDFGTLVGSTHLIQIDTSAEYSNVSGKKLIYDTLAFKFGKMQMLVSYDPQIEQCGRDWEQNWSFGSSRIQITNEFNFGVQVKTCEPVFHTRFPSTILNFKVKEMSLFISRKIWSTYFRYVSIYRHGKFWKTLGQYLGVEDIQHEEVEEKMEEIFGEDYASNLQPVPLQEGVHKESQIHLKLDEAQQRQSSVKKNRIFEDIQEESKDESLEENGVHSLIEFGIESVKGRIISVTGQDTVGHIFVTKIYAEDVRKDSKAYFKYLIFNPFLEEEANHFSKSPSYFRSLDQKYSLHSAAKPLNLLANNRAWGQSYTVEKSTVVLDFSDFVYFNPEQEDLSLNNQLVIKFTTNEDTSAYDILIQNLRIIFIIPLLEKILRFYIDLQIDIEGIEKEVKKQLASKVYSLQHQGNIGQKRISQRNIEEQKKKEVNSEDPKKADNPFTSQKSSSPKKFYLKNNQKESLKQQKNDLARVSAQSKLLQPSQRPSSIELIRKEQEKWVKVTKTVKSKIIVTINISGFEVHFPTNIYNNQSMMMKISVKSAIQYDSTSITEEDFLKNKDTKIVALKFKESRIMASDSKLNIDLQQLSMYVEENDAIGDEAEDNNDSALPEKIYFLLPYDLNINIDSDYKYLDTHKSLTETYITYNSPQKIQMSIGFKEFNNYLVLFQLYFKFSNDWAEMQAEIDPQLKERINYAKNMNKMTEMKGSISQEDLTIEEILINENMVQKKKKFGDLWKKGLINVIDQKQIKDFVVFINDFNIKGLELVFTDNIGDFDQTLLAINIQDFSMYIESRGFDTLDMFKNERFFQEEQIQFKQIHLGHFFTFKSKWTTQCLYYNCMNFSQESLIESFPFTINISQERPLSETTSNFSSDKFININLTYGFVCTLSRAFKNIVAYEDKHGKYEEFKDSSAQEEELKELYLNEKFAKPSLNYVGKNCVTSVQLKVRQNFRRKQLEEFVQQNKQTHKISQRYLIDGELSQVKKKIEEEQNENMGDTLFSINDITELVFMNCIGVNVKFCFNIFAKELSNYKDTNKDKSSKNVKRLKKNEHLILPIYEIDEFLKEAQHNHELMFYDKTRMCMKINFVVDGFQQVKNVALQRNGIFGYFLYDEHHHNQYQQDKKAKSAMSCIIRIIRDRYTTYIHFESSLVIFNYTLMTLFVNSKEQGQQAKESHEIKEKKILNAPFKWFKNKAAISIKGDAEDDKEVDLYSKITDVCNPRITEPYDDYSKCINIKGRYIAIDVFFLKTKTNVGQFLLIIQPIMKLTNFLFTDLSINHPLQDDITYTSLKTKESKYLYQIDPYADTQNDIKLKFRESEFDYYENTVQLKMSKATKNEAIQLNKGFIFQLNGEPRDQDKQRYINVVFELLENVSALKDTEYDNFLLRKKIYSSQKSLVFTVYIPYMAINQTNMTIQLSTLHAKPMLHPQSSLYFLPKSTKMKMTVEDYHLSDQFSIDTYGVSGSIQLKRHKLKKNKNHPEIVDDESQELPHQIEIGTYIALCDHPYLRTKVVKFVPRYFIINKMDLPIVMKENNQNYQMVTTKDEEITFNFSCVQNSIQLRIINLDEETNVNKLKAQSEQRPRQGSAYRMISAKSSEPNSAVKHDGEKHSEDNSRKEGEADEIDDNGDELEIYVKKDYGATSDRSVWSYKFFITDIDDFQITLPNLNKNNSLVKDKKSWSESGDQIFVRVTISPSQEHGGSMFVTFSKPYYPEYVFFNGIDMDIQVTHKAQKKKREKIYENDKIIMKPQDKRAIVLNPRGKDDDILIIHSLKENGQLGQKFKYEIDSLKKQVTLHDKKYFICTKTTGNLRFIHLMTLEEMYEKRKLKQEMKAKQEENLAYTMANHGPGQSNKQNQDQESIFYITRQAFQLKGIGISIVDFQPKELFFISLYQIRFKYFTKYMKKRGVEKNHQVMSLKLGNMQIDNMQVRSNTVIVGPKRPFNYREKQFKKTQGVKLSGEETKYVDETNEYIVMTEGVNDFLRIKIDQQFMTEGQISNQRIKLADVKLQEINVLIHSSSLNALSQLKASIDDLISDEVVNPFKNSILMRNYTKLMNIWYLIDIDPLEQDGKGAERGQEMMRQKTQGNAPRNNDYGKSLYNNDTSLNSRNQNAFTSYQQSRMQDDFKPKEDVCPFIKCDKIDLPDDFMLTAQKIMVEDLRIMAFRFFITFRVSKLENKGGAQGFYYVILNFLSNFANISDAEIYFSEIEIKNAYKTMDQLNKALQAQYMKEGIQQFYQLLGSSDIIGNPAGLINNMGRAVNQMYSEPFQGIIEGDARKAAMGFAKGVKGLVSNTTVGVTNSLSKFSGTLFISMKNIQGIQQSESDLDNPQGILSGFAYGGKGLVTEIGKGVTGIVQLPAQRLRNQGVGCGQITKGTAQGLFGCIASPLTGVLKLLHQSTTGIMNFASGGKADNKRFRVPRYIDERDVIRAYDPDFSHAYAALQTVQDGLYKNETIILAYDVSSMAGRKHNVFQDAVIICTEERILYVEELKILKVDIPLVDIENVFHSIGNKTQQIVIVMKNTGKFHYIKTQNEQINGKIVAQVKSKVLTNQLSHLDNENNNQN